MSSRAPRRFRYGATSLGETQVNLLAALLREGRNYRWFVGCGWYWDNWSDTTRVMESLTRKGFLERTEEKLVDYTRVVFTLRSNKRGLAEQFVKMQRERDRGKEI